MSKVFQELLNLRGVGEDFLSPKYEDCISPQSLPDLKPAIERLKQARERDEKVLIYGDYDVDGVTASTAMSNILKLLGITKIEIMLPNRFTDGYGMSEKLVDKAKSEKFNLVVTVDCGSRNHQIIEKLNTAKIDTIITDHHECSDTLPDAIAVVNPKRTDIEIPPEFRQLAGVGVAFKLAQGLVEAGLIPNGQEKWLLDLVAIGTICDSMPLVGENRRLCYYGFKVLAKTRRPGLKELLKRVSAKKLSGDTIGFQIGPRLNAAGRLDTAEKSLGLLRAESRPAAAKLADELETLNQTRRAQQNSALKELESRGLDDNPVIVVQGDWNEGIIGIIAGHLTEIYHRPSFVFTPGAEDILKGSGRSFGDFNLALALKHCQDIILGGGGHAEACGVQIESKHFELFQQMINDFYHSLNLKDQEKYLTTSEDLAVQDFDELSLELVSELQKLEPFGIGNPEPVFLLPEARIIESNRLGKNGEHLRLVVWDQAGHSFKLMWFYAPEKYLQLETGESINAWVTLCENEFRGIRSIEGRIVRLNSI